MRPDKYSEALARSDVPASVAELWQKSVAAVDAGDITSGLKLAEQALDAFAMAATSDAELMSALDEWCEHTQSLAESHVALVEDKTDASTPKKSEGLSPDEQVAPNVSGRVQESERPPHDTLTEKPEGDKPPAPDTPSKNKPTEGLRAVKHAPSPCQELQKTERPSQDLRTTKQPDKNKLPVPDDIPEADPAELAELAELDAYLAAGGLTGPWQPEDDAAVPRKAAGAARSQAVQRSSQTAEAVEDASDESGPLFARLRKKFGTAEAVLAAGILGTLAILALSRSGDNKDVSASDVAASVRLERGDFPVLELTGISRAPVSYDEVAGRFERQRWQRRQEALAALQPEATPKPKPQTTPPRFDKERREHREQRKQEERAIVGQNAGIATGGVSDAPSSDNPAPGRRRHSRPKPRRHGGRSGANGGAKLASSAQAPSVVDAEPAQQDDDAPPLGWFFSAEPRRNSVRTASKKNTTKKAKKLDVPIGTPLHVRLVVGLTSSRPGEVLARLTKPIHNEKGLIAPAGAMLVGKQWGSDAKRIYVRFFKLIVGDEEPYTLSGEAIWNSSPGIAAQVRKATLDQRQASALAQAGLEIGKDLATGLLGPASNVARELAEGAVDEAKQEQKVDTSVMLVVPAGTEFDVITMS